MALSYLIVWQKDKTFEENQAIKNKTIAVLELKGNIKTSKLSIEIYLKK